MESHPAKDMCILSSKICHSQLSVVLCMLVVQWWGCIWSYHEWRDLTQYTLSRLESSTYINMSERICECVDFKVQTAMACRLLQELDHGKKVRGQDEICSSIIPVSPLSPRFLISWCIWSGHDDDDDQVLLMIWWPYEGDDNMMIAIKLDNVTKQLV